MIDKYTTASVIAINAVHAWRERGRERDREREGGGGREGGRERESERDMKKGKGRVTATSPVYN